MRTCPICGEEYAEPPAISRTDNKTEICSVKRRIVFGRDDELFAGITHRQKPVKEKPLRGAFSVLDGFLAMS